MFGTEAVWELLLQSSLHNSSFRNYKNTPSKTASIKLIKHIFFRRDTLQHFFFFVAVYQVGMWNFRLIIRQMQGWTLGCHWPKNSLNMTVCLSASFQSVCTCGNRAYHLPLQTVASLHVHSRWPWRSSRRNCLQWKMKRGGAEPSAALVCNCGDSQMQKSSFEGGFEIYCFSTAFKLTPD